MATKQANAPREAKHENEVIGENNFREVADRAIEQYQKKGMIIDALLWAKLIGHYNAALDAAKARITELGG